MVETPEPKRHPIGGVDYPRDLREFHEWLPNDEACLRYLERVRWPDGFVCPTCRAMGEVWRMTRGRLRCTVCRGNTTVTAGTIFHRTRTPLRTWFLAAWEITSQKYGTNALGLQRVLGFKSYRTAWAWLHRFRRAMLRPDRDKLSGTVEVDETYVGGKEAGVTGRETIKKAIVAIAVEVKDERIARVRLRWIPDVSGDSLVPFVEDVVEAGATVHTDGWRGYNGLAEAGYDHQVTVVSTSPDPAHVLMPHVHRVASLLKRWVLGTLQGGISKEHLDYYLDEFTFRFNRRSAKARGLLFYRLIEQAVQTDPVPLKELEQGTGRGPPSG